MFIEVPSFPKYKLYPSIGITEAPFSVIPIISLVCIFGNKELQ